MSTEPRPTRTICFRIDADEYEKFRQLCLEQGSGNLSEMARAGLKMILTQPAIAHTESLDRRVTDLEARLRSVFLEMRKLHAHSAPVPAAVSLSEAL